MKLVSGKAAATAFSNFCQTIS